MLKKTVTIVLLGLAPAAFSTSFFNHIGMSALRNTPQLKMSALNSLEKKVEYTDFSGTWTGTCRGMEGRTDIDMSSLIIANTAQSITINGEEIPIGGFINASFTKQSFEINEHLLLNWTENGQVLTADGVTVARLSDFMITQIITSHFTLSKKDNQLAFNGKVTSASGDFAVDVSCTLFAE